jgi:tetratricopeptide (TPR) repeat protein
VYVLLPENTKEFRKLVREDYESGLYVSGPRVDWITADPGASHLSEVLTHEYVHAVLNRVAPDLPRWLNEGICEYFASLRQEGSSLVIGSPPGNRLALLSRGRVWDRRLLEGRDFPPEAYAWAWAHVHQAAPAVFASLAGWQDLPWRTPRPGDDFRPRRLAIAFPAGPAPVRLRAVETEELRESAAEAFAVTPGESSAEAKFLAGLRLADEGRAREAVPLLEEAVRLRPSQSSWWLILSAAYGELGNQAGRRAAAQRALETAVTETERKAAQAAIE